MFLKSSKKKIITKYVALRIEGRRVGRNDLGDVNKLEKMGPARGCKTEIVFSSIYKDTTYSLLIKY